MDYTILRNQASSIADPIVRQRELSRIEGEYHLYLALHHLQIQRTGKMPDQGRLDRLVSAIQVLAAESHSDRDGKTPAPEVAVRLGHALEVLHYEL